MTQIEVQALISAMETIAQVLGALGVPGLLGLVLAGPVVVLTVVLVLDYMRGKRMEQVQQEYRADTTRLLEVYRCDTQTILREIGREHSEAVQFYSENVELVRDYQRVADALQTLVINNTRAVERLVVLMEKR